MDRDETLEPRPESRANETTENAESEAEPKAESEVEPKTESEAESEAEPTVEDEAENATNEEPNRESAVPGNLVHVIPNGWPGFTEFTALNRNRRVDIVEASVFEERMKRIRMEEVPLLNPCELNVYGEDIPSPISSYDALRIDADLLDNLKSKYQVSPSPIQQQILSIMVEGRNLLVCEPRDVALGKTYLSFIIDDLKAPSTDGFRAAILCPNQVFVDMAYKDVQRLLGRRPLKLYTIRKVKDAFLNFGNDISSKFDILITTPNKLSLALNECPNCLSFRNMKWFVIDFADRLLDNGHQRFKEQLSVISNASRLQSLMSCKKLMFSSVQAPLLVEWCDDMMPGVIKVIREPRNTPMKVDQQLSFVGNDAGRDAAIKDVLGKHVMSQVLVIVRNDYRAEHVYHKLKYNRIDIGMIHANHSEPQRNTTLEAFLSGCLWVLITTEVMARCLGLNSMNIVINYDFPPTGLSYIHRMKCASNPNNKSRIITFVTLQDSKALKGMLKVLRRCGCEVPFYLHSMREKTERKWMYRNRTIPRIDYLARPLQAEY